MRANNELLRRELVKYVHERSPSRGSLVGEIAKAPSRRQSNPDWMKVKAFDGRSWLDLGIHERKYLLRKTIPDMLARGVLRLEECASVVQQQSKFRLRVGSLLDVVVAVCE
jgi:hypothetical protein